MDCTVLDAIHAARVDLAKRLLADGPVRVGDLPSRCGFRSEPAFRRVFTKIAGVSPLRYAQSVRRPAVRGGDRRK